MEKEILKKLEEEARQLTEQLGAEKERGRILRELNEADLPLGVWPLIQDIIMPPRKKESLQANKK